MQTTTPFQTVVNYVVQMIELDAHPTFARVFCSHFQLEMLNHLFAIVNNYNADEALSFLDEHLLLNSYSRMHGTITRLIIFGAFLQDTCAPDRPPNWNDLDYQRLRCIMHELKHSVMQNVNFQFDMLIRHPTSWI